LLKGNDLSRKLDATTSASLVLKLRDHSDASAWSEFVDVYSPLIYGFCRAREVQSSDAADITQEVLLRVSKAMRTFEYDRAKGLFRDWLAKVVLNEIRRYSNKTRPTATDPNELDQDAGVIESEWNEHFHQHIFAKALERCKLHFTNETWSLFESTWIHKRPAEDVATERGIGIDRIYVARSRVLKRLRYEVGVLADDWNG
jgi:RNA polymerase sigma factor (sigma-70 family)